MAFALVVNVKGSGSNTFATSAIDTTGADLLVACWAGQPSTVSDSKSNTWTQPAGAEVTGQYGSRIVYADAATVGSGHTFTLTMDGGFLNGTMQVYAFSGSDTGADPLDDVSEGQVFGSATVQPGSVTSTTDDQLIVSHIGHSRATATIDSSFTSPAGAGTGYGDATSPGFYDGSHSAYLIQTTAGAVNPTWTVDDAGNLYTTIATFKAGAGGGGGAAPPVLRGVVRSGLRLN